MLEVRLLGKFEIKCDGKPVIISSRAAQSLFAYLSLTAGTLHRREKLAGMFWPDAPEEKARAYLRHELWRIRKAFSPHSKVDYLLADDINISFNSSAEYWLDLAALKNVSETSSIEELMKALSVFQGELLPGFYDDWVTQEREHLQAVHEQKIARLLELLESEKRWNDILEWAECWISIGQGPELAYQHLITAYDALGDRAKVISTYERCVQALRALDLEPSEQTRAQAFRRTSKLNIPIPLTSFIGREKELKEIADLLSKSRLVTLTGSGGVGKTRLAIQVVAEIFERFPDGIGFLDLAPLSDPALVPNTLAGLLGLRESGELPITDILINYFRTRNALVVFDNCEHLIEACAQLVNLLLTSCANLSILATSREALRVSGEVPYRVPSLEIPKSEIEFDIEKISNMEAVKLFSERAAVISLGFAISSQSVLVIAQICQRLDGIPLAIELAAARTNMLTVEQISNRLDDRFNILVGGTRSALPRHQTLRATIEWSYDLLSEQERILFRRLAVFMGGWTLEAAEEVCSGNGIESNNILNLLSQLVSKSLVLVETEEGEIRYHRHETTRQFARERLVESGEEKNSRTLHLKYFLELSERAESEIRGSEGKKWFTRWNNERDNIRAALEWADQTNVEAGMYIAGRLHDFWESFDLREGQRWLARFVQKPESKAYFRARAKALRALGDMLYDSGQLAQAHSLMLESLALFQVCGDKASEVFALLGLAYILEAQGDKKQSIEFTERALALAQTLGDTWRQAWALTNLGHLKPPEPQDRVEFWEKVSDMFRKAGDWQALADRLGDLGLELVLDGDIESAQKYLAESTLILEHLQTKAQWMPAKMAYSQIALQREDYAQARALLEEIMLTTNELGSPMSYFSAKLRLGYVALREGNLTEAGTIFTECIQVFQMDGIADNIVFTQEGIASLLVAACKPEQAARLFGWTDAMCEKDSYARSRIEQADVDRDFTAIIARIGKTAFEEECKVGRVMMLDEAVALALKELKI